MKGLLDMTTIASSKEELEANGPWSKKRSIQDYISGTLPNIGLASNNTAAEKLLNMRSAVKLPSMR